MPEQIRRPFATGSKPGPDAVDHYLETQGYYRKHVARDASSLFRVVAEQIFDIQNYHEKVRQASADFIEAHSKDYSNEVDKNLYNYISNLRKPRTHGTLLELRVLARKYRRNVVLFEPTQNLQTTSAVYVQNDEYDANEPMRVFYSQKDKHFDVIYTMEYVERLAECQSIVYMLLYSDVYKLPDVPYAVERMLHDQEEQVTLPLPEDPSKYTKQSGDVIAFDSPEDTKCVLKDPKTCHFHNLTNFEEIVDENKDAITVINRTDEPGRLKIFKPIDGFLHDKDKSCVRQLLDEHITPFPYKVAKALDPSIYRNTEFELWSENRKEQRLKWLDSPEFPMKPHPEDKWIVYDRRGMRKSYDAIVDECEYMAMDDDMKKKYVVLNPTAEPFKLHQLTGLNHFVPSKESLELTVMPVNGNFGGRGNFKGNKRGGRYNYRDGYANQNFQSRNFVQQPPPMPHVSEIEGREGSFPPQEQQESQPGYYQQSSQTEAENYEQQQQAYPHTYQTYQQPQMWPKPMPLPMSPYSQPQPIHFMPQHPPMRYQNVMPYGNFSIPPPIPAELQYSMAPSSDPNSSDSGDCMNLMREAELTSTMVNWKPKESSDVNGADLPLNDLPTVQFYFNLGVRYFLASGIQRRLENVSLQMENLEIVDGADKTDPPPVPTNTPVTTKGNYSQPNRQHHQGGNNFRRQGGNGNNFRGNWNNGGNGNGGPRKEIRFNSNVKNVHKNDPKAGNQAVCGKSKADAPATPKVQDKTSPTSQYSPLSPISMEAPSQYQHPQPVEYQQIPVQQPYYPYPQSYVQPQQVPPGINVVYQVNEDGTYTLMQPMQQPTYQYPQYQGQQQTPHFQPTFQHPQFAPPTPVFYQPLPNYQQPQQQIMDGSAVSNDSGMIEANVYQAPPPFYPQYPQVIYTQTPIPQTPQLAPAFPNIVTQVSQEITTQTSDDQRENVKN